MMKDLEEQIRTNIDVVVPEPGLVAAPGVFAYGGNGYVAPVLRARAVVIG